MRIGLITIVDPIPNYGNKLQHYASYKVLKRLNNDVTSYTMEKPIITNKKCLVRMFHKITFYKFTKRKSYWKYGYLKEKKFDRFNKRTLKICHIKSIENLDGTEDIFFVGSDQVWNTNWFNEKKEEMFLLKFVRDGKRRNSFSSSFGTNSLDNNWKQKFTEELTKFSHISVREEAGAKIIKELIGRNAEVIVDPTMLLTKEEWRAIATRPNNADDGFILTYFLSPKCYEASKIMNEIKEDRKVYELLDLKDRVVGAASPTDFIWLFDHADIVLTDSFHACVFSFLFNKPFIVFDRNWQEENTNSRIETLLHTFHLERKYINSGLENDIWEHDYTEGYKQLEIERKKAFDFLRESLED